MRRLVAGMLLSMLAPLAQADVLRIEITRGVTGALPVAVVPFAWEGEGEAPLDVAGVIGANLQRSGRFRR